MTHLADFNILSSRHKHRSQSSCNVVINNQTGTSSPQVRNGLTQQHNNESPIMYNRRRLPVRQPTITNPEVEKNKGNSDSKSNEPTAGERGTTSPPPVPSAVVPPVVLPVPSAVVPPVVYPDYQDGYSHGIPPGQEHLYPTYPPMVMERSVNLEDNTSNEVNYELEMYKLLAKTYGDILRNNNAKLIANLIDPSGKVIVEAESLCRIIALTCEVSPETIHIEYETTGGCCVKINPIRKVKNIKVNNLDFKLGYNEKYNNLTDIYHISLKKTIIPIDELL